MKNELRATGLLLLAMAVPASLEAQWNDWLGGDGDWMDGGNWSEGTPPDATEYAGFRDSGVNHVTLDVSRLVGRFYVWGDSDLNLGLGSGVDFATDAGFFTTQTGSAVNISGPASGEIATFTVGTGAQALVLNGPSAMTFSGPLLTFNASLNVGRQGDDGTLRVENGAVGNSATVTTGNVADRSGGNNLHIEVDGAGTVLNVDSDSNIPINIASRPRSEGSATNFQENNSLTISDGAQVLVNNSREPGLSPAGVDIGHGDFYKRDNWIEVTGSGSLLEIRGENIVTRIGRPDSESNYNNYMLVADGGVIQTEGATEINRTLAENGELKNRLFIGDGGSYITSESITIEGGLLQLAAGGQLIGADFENQPVPVDIDVNTVDGAMGRFEAAGSGLDSTITLNVDAGSVFAVGLGDATEPSVLTLDSTVNMLADSRLELTIFGDNAMDSIDFAGGTLNPASDAVDLDVLLGDGYEPAFGDTFQAFTGNVNITNEFTAILLPELEGSLGWDLSDFDSAGDWSFSVIPEPGTYALFVGLGVLALVAFRRVGRSRGNGRAR